ncbi:hypothetical protein HF086_001810 [Spodoptera exigua]|uniref:Uncharacterized protein n=1 Tax=Spodoptera exigua TaxID=7107 RepID=A0A922SN07_SPOEX|nr:hypothetical protein HF086_001810 [Spodoptera exigua]
MQLLPILICVGLASMTHAKLYTRFPKPKVNYLQLQNSQNYEFKPLLPEERRKLPLFSRNPVKFVISLEPTNKISKPYLERKKPLMKKLTFQGKKEIYSDNEKNQPKDEAILNEIDVVQTPIVEVDVIKEISVEIIEDEPEESEFQNDDSEKQDQFSDIIEPQVSSEESPDVEETHINLSDNEINVATEKENVNDEEEIDSQNDASEEKNKLSDRYPKDDSDKRNIVRLADILLPPKAEIKTSVEDKSGELLPDDERPKESQFQSDASGKQDELSVTIESEAHIDIHDTKNFVQLADIILAPKPEVSADYNRGEILPDVKEIKEGPFQTDVSKKEDKLIDVMESEGKTDKSDEENIVQLTDIILPPKSEPEASIENKSKEVLLDVAEINKSTIENEANDETNKAIEVENVSNGEPGDFVITDIYEEPVIYRKKRGINIIEEENLASTVAGFKYTVRDRRLNNHLAYNNINS